MAASDALVLALMLLASVLLPCVVAVICTDHLLQRVAPGQCERRRYRRLDRQLRRNPAAILVLTNADWRPSIQWIAADLRRLDRQRNGLARESRLWHAAVLRAYDNRLQLASRCLGVPEHLEQLFGIDREIERVRVEGELEAAGLTLRSPHRRRTDRH